MSKTAIHFRDNVLPSYDEYMEAEGALTAAAGDSDCARLTEAKKTTLRRAGAFAIFADGLRDRWAEETQTKAKAVDLVVGPLCTFADSGWPRPNCIIRLRAVANAFKHATLKDPALPIRSDEAVVVLGAGFGIDGYSVPKLSGGDEVLVLETGGDTWCFRGDAHCVVRAWAQLLNESGHPVETRAW